jgi:hypothetical protein
MVDAVEQLFANLIIPRCNVSLPHLVAYLTETYPLKSLQISIQAVLQIHGMARKFPE